MAPEHLLPLVRRRVLAHRQEPAAVVMTRAMMIGALHAAVRLVAVLSARNPQSRLPRVRKRMTSGAAAS